MTPTIVKLRRDLARKIKEGQPWIFREALHMPPTLADGTLVELQGVDGKPLAVGYWDARSPIALRLLEAGKLPDPEKILRLRLKEALARRRARIDPKITQAFRWVHGEADRLPGIHVDLYDDVAVVRFDGDGARAYYRNVSPLLLEAAKPLTLRGIVDRQTGRRLAGTIPEKMQVLENGLRFEVSPGSGGKGGLFLDQRENRALVERLAKGATVLNLFGYSGGFSLYAARGGAARTDTVDVAKLALDAARRNFELNGFPLETAGFHAADAFEFLEAAVAKRRTWSLVITDPPSFAPRKSATEGARKSYIRLHRLAAAVTAKGGTLCAASCSSHFPRKDFIASIETGVKQAARRFRLDDTRGAGFDHPVIAAFPEGNYLKFAVGRVD